MTELSREAILAMVPGLKLDILVRQLIFKYKYPSVEEMRITAYEQWKNQPECIHFLMEFDAWREGDEFKWQYRAPNYSDNIAAAWKVVWKMETKWSWELQMINLAQEVDVRIGNGHVTSKNVPEAICKAALLTTLEEESR